MRIWLDPDKVATRDLSANEVLSALRAQNLQVSAGILNQPPSRSDEAYQINVEALGRLATPEQFADIIVKSDRRGRVTRIRDIGRVEVGAADYGSTTYMDRSNATTLLRCDPDRKSQIIRFPVGVENEGTVYRGRRRSDADDSRRLRQAHRRGNREMGQGDPGDQHKVGSIALAVMQPTNGAPSASFWRANSTIRMAFREGNRDQRPADFVHRPMGCGHGRNAVAHVALDVFGDDG
jgi:hypothetical protein